MNPNPTNRSSRRKKALINRRSENPKGIPQQSPGLRAPSYPGKTPPKNHNPERVAAPHEHQHDAKNGSRRNPVGVDESLSDLPRVARCSQPWAELHNPVGIERECPSLWSGGLFQRLEIDLPERVGDITPHLRIRIVQQLQQGRHHGSGIFTKSAERIRRPQPVRFGSLQPFHQEWKYYRRSEPKIQKGSCRNLSDHIRFFSQAPDQGWHRRTSIRPHVHDARSSNRSQPSWLLVGQSSQERRQPLRPKTCQCSRRSFCAGHCFWIVQNSNEFWDTSLRRSTKGGESRDCAVGTKLPLVGEFPIGGKFFQCRIHEVVKLCFPRWRLIPNPPQQMGNNYVRSKSHLLDGNSRWAWLSAYLYVCTLGRCLHPLTQLLPPILRLRRGPKDDRNHTNQHPNPNQAQEEASSLFHGPTIMRPHGAETSRKAQQQGNNFSQKQTKITKTGKGISETSSFPSFPSVKEYFFALHLFASCSAIRAIRVIRGSISLRAPRYLLFKSDSRPFAFIRGSHNPIFHLLSPNS